MKTLLLAPLLAVLACAANSDQNQIRRMVKTTGYAQTRPPEIREAINMGRVFPGMSKEDVLQAKTDFMVCNGETSRDSAGRNERFLLCYPECRCRKPIIVELTNDVVVAVK